MKKTILSVCLVITLGSTLYAQARRATIVTYGDATLSVDPDQVKVSVGVTTRAVTAQDAAGQNATTVTAVIAAVQQAVGSKGTIKTTSYSVSPVYIYPQNTNPVLTGYTVSNTLDVTSSDIAGIGKVIDAATNAGANNVASLRFSVKDETPVRAKALQQATINARSKAESIALGVNLRVGNLISVQEGYNSQIVTVRAPTTTAGVASAPTTPVDPGLVQVTASVTLELELN